MCEPWQLWQQLAVARRFRFQIFPQAAPADLLVHPVFQIRLGGFPQVQFRIKLASESFDVEQGLLQQHQLRLHFDIEAARSLEQAQQDLAE
ncbi:hypothetical protein D3C77_695340 [compost metagenome]